MPREDRSFSAEDVLRIYKRNLEPWEQAIVRNYFKAEVFGGPSYLTRLVRRTFEEFGRHVAFPRQIDEEQSLFLQNLIHKEVSRRNR